MINFFKKTLLSPQEVKLFISRSKSPRILNCSFTQPVFPNEKDEIFQKQRIPNASFFDIDYVTDKSFDLPHMLPTLDQFKKFMEELNISVYDDIVLYDDFSILGSARVWWTFKVFGKNTVILNANSNQWKDHGYELEEGEP